MISEIDLKDWERLDPKPLYNVPPKSFILDTDTNMILWFDHLDGMYSYCTNDEGIVYHIAGWHVVVPLKERNV